MKASFPTVGFDVVPQPPRLQAHSSSREASTADNSDMIYFSRDECTNLLPRCPVRIICYVTPSTLFSMMINSLC